MSPYIAKTIRPLEDVLSEREKQLRSQLRKITRPEGATYADIVSRLAELNWLRDELLPPFELDPE